METETPGWRLLVLPVAFVLGCFVLSVAAWRAFDGSTPLQAARYEFSAQLPSAAGLVPGADVRMAGVVVGRITKVQRDGTRARVTSQLKPRYVPLRTRATVIARTKSLLGEAYLEVAPGPVSAPALRDGETLAASQVRESQQLSDVLSTFSPQTRRDAQALFAGLATGLDGRGTDVNETLGWAEPATANFASLFRILDGQRSALQQLIGSAADVFDTIGERQAALTTAIDAGDRVLAVTASRDRALRATVRALPPFLTRLRAASGTIDAASGELQRAAVALEPVAPQVAPLLRSVKANAPRFEALFRELPPVLDSGRRNLREVGRITRAARPALAKVYPSLREIIPFVQLLNANREEITAVLGNVGALLNAEAYGPGDKLVNYGTGIPTVWNEVIGGWIRKLPTNRANPYLKPQGLRTLADKGYIEAYDCRHLGNPLYLPATGSGAPPCHVQGAWPFQGTTAFYPNLTPAAP